MIRFHRECYLLITIIMMSSSCSSVASNFVTKDSFLLVKDFILGYPQDRISQEYFENSEGSFAVMRFGRGKPSIISLAYIQNGIYEWRSSDGVKVFTKNGLVVKTQGLPSDMELSPSCLYSEIDLDGNMRVCKATFYNPDLVLTPLYITRNINSTESILRFDQDALVSTENFSIYLPDIKWSKKNSFSYLNNELVASSQSIHPRLPRVHLEFYFVY